MIVYLKDINTNEVLQTFENVVNWGNSFVEFLTDKQRTKIYCDENHYFTDQNEQN